MSGYDSGAATQLASALPPACHAGGVTGGGVSDKGMMDSVIRDCGGGQGGRGGEERRSTDPGWKSTLGAGLIGQDKKNHSIRIIAVSISKIVVIRNHTHRTCLWIQYYCDLI